MPIEPDEQWAAPDVTQQPLPALDREELARVRTVIGPPVSDESTFRVRLRPRNTELSEVTFLLNDIERKLDKLVGTEAAVEQLTNEVRQLSAHVARLERALEARTQRPPRTS